jgi:hypothetical protein
MATISALYSSSFAANMVDIGMTCEGQHDTIWTEDYGGNPVLSSLDIYIENDVVLGGMSLGFKIWCPVKLTYAQLPESYGPEPGNGWLVINPGSRLDPPDHAFDMTGLLISEQNVDGLLHDTVLFGGVALMRGLQPGPLEKMFSIYFTAQPTMWCAGYLCIDTAFVPPAGDFIFTDADGQNFTPDVLWEYGSKCWMVSPREIHPHVSGKVIVEPDTINARDAYSIESKTVAIRIGFSCIDAEDIILSTVRINGSDSLIPISMAIVDPITDYSNSALEMIFDMSDFILDFENLFWNTTVKHVSVSGDFSNGYWIDGGYTYDRVTFIGLIEGDANGDDIVDIGDAVCICHHLYRGGPEPVPWETADPDGDSSITPADAVYLFNYVFTDGPAPTHP